MLLKKSLLFLAFIVAITIPAWADEAATNSSMEETATVKEELKADHAKIHTDRMELKKDRKALHEKRMEHHKAKHKMHMKARHEHHEKMKTEHAQQ